MIQGLLFGARLLALACENERGGESHALCVIRHPVARKRREEKGQMRMQRGRMRNSHMWQYKVSGPDEKYSHVAIQGSKQVSGRLCGACRSVRVWKRGIAAWLGSDLRGLTAQAEVRGVRRAVVARGEGVRNTRKNISPPRARGKMQHMQSPRMQVFIAQPALGSQEICPITSSRMQPKISKKSIRLRPTTLLSSGNQGFRCGIPSPSPGRHR